MRDPKAKQTTSKRGREKRSQPKRQADEAKGNRKMDKKWEIMQAKIDMMEKRVTIGRVYVNLEMLGSSPFTQEVDQAMPPKGFKLPTMEAYDGRT